MTTFSPLAEAARARLLSDANYHDDKTIVGDVNLREFIAQSLSYHPQWMRALYMIRAGFVRLLGMRQDQMATPHLRPQDIRFTPEQAQTFFTVSEGREDDYWIAYARDKHLTAHLMVSVARTDDGRNHFRATTIVHYHHWTGPVYFNVIRPFHHVVVASMLQAGIRRPAAAPARL
jgi:hypothetical protein